MDITLKELNRSYPELQNICSQPLPKGKGDIARKLGRIKRAADTAIENWVEDQKKIALPYGFRIIGPGQVRPVEDGAEIKIETIEAFNKECDGIMKTETIHFRGEPFTPEEWKEIEPLFSLSGETLASLEWLILDDYSSAAEPEPEKAVAVSA